jgi:hypothetical protein
MHMVIRAGLASRLSLSAGGLHCQTRGLSALLATVPRRVLFMLALLRPPGRLLLAILLWLLVALLALLALPLVLLLLLPVLVSVLVSVLIAHEFPLG